MALRLSFSQRIGSAAGSSAVPASDAPERWFTLSAEQTAALLNSDLELGLSGSEPAERRKRWGDNTLKRQAGRAVTKIALDQFKNLIVVLLLIAAGLAYSMDGGFEASMILIVVGLNAVIGFFTEFKAQRALIHLQKLDIQLCRVIRDGREQRIGVAELVPGDLILIEAGDRVPADGRIVASHGLQVDESALTGESMAVEKVSAPLSESHQTLADLTNMAFMETLVLSGRGRMLVTATGVWTELGKIGRLIGETSKRASPLETRLQHLGSALAAIVAILCAVMLAVGLIRSMPFMEMLRTALSLAIAAVPEGLLAVSTMSLALGMQRMARKGALIRNLAAVETLGSATVICTDKTGTLTRNQMTVEKLVVDDQFISVTGTGYGFEGRFRDSAGSVDLQRDEPVLRLLRIGALCNDAKVTHTKEETIVLGDPTEAALIVLAHKAGIDTAALKTRYPRMAEVPFSTETKRMVTEHSQPSGPPVEYAKGAPLRILELCEYETGPAGRRSLTVERRDWWQQANARLASAALRVLGFAYRELPAESTRDATEGQWVFAGLAGMIDPLRDEAIAAIERCREAGIATVMITGDQVATAQVIASRLGIDHGADGGRLETVHARNLTQLDPQAVSKLLPHTAVFARAEPAHKLQIVRAFQQLGQVVAMTGDGVNDAPALRQADIGIAMGAGGTDVARQSADMVITDNNFITIVHAVEQGRVLYANIIHFVHYLLSCNLAELLTVFLAIMFGWPLPLAPLQILWLNMITDIFPALALALEPSAPDVMKRRPRAPDSALLTPHLTGIIAWQGLLLAIATLAAFYTGLRTHPEDTQHAVTMAFMTLSFVQIFHAFSARSTHRSAFTSRLFTNLWLWAAVAFCTVLQVMSVHLPALRLVLGTTELQAQDWSTILVCAIAPMMVIELAKLKR